MQLKYVLYGGAIVLMIGHIAAFILINRKLKQIAELAEKNHQKDPHNVQNSHPTH